MYIQTVVPEHALSSGAQSMDVEKGSYQELTDVTPHSASHIVCSLELLCYHSIEFHSAAPQFAQVIFRECFVLVIVINLLMRGQVYFNY